MRAGPVRRLVLDVVLDPFTHVVLVAVLTAILHILTWEPLD
jgi:hypothetical protein